MTVEEARDLILKKFKAAWAERTQVAWQNVFFDPSSQSSWVRPSVIQSSGSQASLGASGDRIFRHSGIFVVQIFTPAQEDTEISDEYAQVVLDAFYTNENGVMYSSQSVQTIGVEGDFYQTNISINYEYDDIK